MDKDKQIQKVSKLSLEKLSEDSKLAKRGLRDISRLETSSRDIQTLFNKGVELYKLEKYQEAIDVFDDALEIEPEDTNVLNARRLAMEELAKK